MICVDDSVTVTDVWPGQWHAIFSLLSHTDLVILRLADEGKIVSEVGDRLCSWEYELASEAAAKKRTYPCCSGDMLVGRVYMRCYQACWERTVTHKLSLVMSAGILLATHCAQHHTRFGSSSSRHIRFNFPPHPSPQPTPPHPNARAISLAMSSGILLAAHCAQHHTGFGSSSSRTIRFNPPPPPCHPKASAVLPTFRTIWTGRVSFCPDGVSFCPEYHPKTLFFTQPSHTPFEDTYVHKTPPNPPQNNPFLGLNLKVGNENYRLGNLDRVHPTGQYVEKVD